MLKKTILMCATALSTVWSLFAAAQDNTANVTVHHPWVRASVAGQQATGGFMQLTAQEPLRLVGVESSAAQQGEVHEMKMDGDIMRMRPIQGLDLPAGQMVELKPGSYHLMLQQLKQPLQEGIQVPMTLVFENVQGQASRLHLQVPVLRMSPHGATKPHAHSTH